MKKGIIAAVILLLAAAGGYYLLKKPDQSESVTEIVKGKVKRGDLVLSVAATGVIKPYVEVEVKSKAGGEIISFPFEEGDRLKAEQVAVRLDPDTEQSRVNQANADLLMVTARLEKAKITLKDKELRLKRQKQLHKDKVISRQELDDALIAVEQARSDVKIVEAELVRTAESLKEAKDRLTDTQIKAPLEGTILKKYVEKGQVIASTLSSASEGTPLFTMADLDKLYVKALVDETDIGRIRPEQESIITVDAFPARRFAGRVIRIAPMGRVENTVTVFDVVIEVTDPEKGMLKPMMTANVEILHDVRKNALLIPSEALRMKEGETGIYLAGPEEAGGPVWTPVKTGESDGIHTEIKSGVDEGAEVILSEKRKQTERGNDFGRSLRRIRR